MADELKKKVLDIICKLHAKTDLGKIEWKKSLFQDTFEVSYEDYSIQISKQLETLHTPGSTYIMEVVDNRGERIEHFSVNVSDREMHPYYKLLKETFNKARRQALNIDGTLDKILKDLD